MSITGADASMKSVVAETEACAHAYNVRAAVYSQECWGLTGRVLGDTGGTGSAQHI
jgi:hypothetical protein